MARIGGVGVRHSGLGLVGLVGVYCECLLVGVGVSLFVGSGW